MPATARRRKGPKGPGSRTATAGPGVTGPVPLVLVGFTYEPPAEPTEDDPHPTGAATFAANSPAADILDVLGLGRTWTKASAHARLHPETVRQWNTRGETALGEHEGLDALHATDPTPEALAYAAFYLLAAQAEAKPVGDALEQIIRAGTDDWRAAAHVLKVLPQAREYRETSRHVVAGDDDGGPVVFDLRESATATMLGLARGFATAPPDDTPPTQE